jgi:hypothetical protein
MIDAVLVVALLLVVPLALSLGDRAVRGEARAAIAAGGVASFSFLFAEGPAAAGLVVPWAVVAAGLTWRRAGTLWRERWEPLPEAVATSFLLAGAGWLLLSRNGTTLLGFDPVIVELTAVHFHFAGFVAPIVTLQLVRLLKRTGSRHLTLARALVFAILAATPVTAAGITFAPWLGAAGALLFAVALSTASVLTMASIRRRDPGSTLLRVSSLSVLAPLVLAVAYAASSWLGTPAPSLRAMVLSHGLLNAFGFALCGVCGWMKLRELEVTPTMSADVAS